MLISDLRQWLIDELGKIYPAREARSVFRLLAGEYLGKLPSALIARKNDPIDPQSLARFTDALNQLKQGIPVQYVLGKVSFLDCEIRVGPGALIPRPETEEMTMLVINDLKKDPAGKLVLDIGTGTACIPAALCKHLENVRITGIDISQRALDYAKENIQVCDKRVRLLRFDFLDEAKWHVLGNYDVIISNPPYLTSADTRGMDRNVLDHEPSEALFVDETHHLAFYQQIIVFSEKHLNPDGCIYLEINEKYGGELLGLLRERGIAGAELLRDFRGRDRFIRAHKPGS